VAVEDAREHLRIVGVSQDTAILRKLKAATHKLQEETGRVLMNSTCVYYRHAFPVDNGPMRLPVAPVNAVTAVKYYDSSGVLQTWAAAGNYEADLKAEPCEVWPVDGVNWPTTKTMRNAVQVEFTAGYGDGPDHVPEELQEALLVLLGALWLNRADTVERPGQQLGGETAYAALADLHRVWWLGQDDDEDDSP
jgi:uncharacterized phiE125 gp8 family phage protein